jgi:hypothetical protein
VSLSCSFFSSPKSGGPEGVDRRPAQHQPDGLRGAGQVQREAGEEERPAHRGGVRGLVRPVEDHGAADLGEREVSILIGLTIER